MAKRKEVINGLHNIFTLNSDDLYDISSFSYEQSVDENTILFVIADSEDVGKYITINGEPKIISENDNFIITEGIVFSGNGGGSGNSGGNSVDLSDYMRRDGSNYIGSLDLVAHSIEPQWTIREQNGNPVGNIKTTMSIEVENGALVDFYGKWEYEDETATKKSPTSCSGNWGNTLPSVNTPQELLVEGITSDTSYSQTISAEKSGLEVKNGKVVKASGYDTSTRTASVVFKHRIYYGATTLSSISSLADLKTIEGTELSDTFAKTFTANCTGGKYIYLAYPSSISGTPEFTVNGFGTSEIEESNHEITNDYGADVIYKVLRIKNIQSGSAIPVNVTKK